MVDGPPLGTGAADGAVLCPAPPSGGGALAPRLAVAFSRAPCVPPTGARGGSSHEPPFHGRLAPVRTRWGNDAPAQA